MTNDGYAFTDKRDNTFSYRTGETLPYRIDRRQGGVEFLEIVRDGNYKYFVNAIYRNSLQGNVLRFAYNGGQVDSVEFYPASSTSNPSYRINYTYTGLNLSSVKAYANKDGGSALLLFNSTSYKYEDPRWPHALTGIVDNNGVLFSTWSYDDKARAISSVGVNNTSRYTISYDDVKLKRTVVGPLNKSTQYNFEKGERTLKLTKVEGDASPSCPASARSIEYDSQGRISRTVDEDGRKTTYVRDAQGRPTSITRGAPLNWGGFRSTSNYKLTTIGSATV